MTNLTLIGLETAGVVGASRVLRADVVRSMEILFYLNTTVNSKYH